MNAAPPRAAIAVVGTELALGQSTDSNSEYLGRWLTRLGFKVRLVLKLPDDERLVAEEIVHALDRADLLILTGGLGTTHDDVTREGLSRAIEKPLRLDEELRRTVAALRPAGVDEAAFMRQAYLPEGARPIGPITGTAPGIALEHQGKAVYALPGVPAEMKAMLAAVGDDLKARFGRLSGAVVRRIGVIGAPEPVVAALINPVIEGNPGITFNILAKPEEIKLTLIAPAGAEDRMEGAKGELLARLGDLVYSPEGASLSEVVGGLLIKAGLTIGVAESITAGQIAALIAATPGSSRYLMGGIIAYDNRIKEQLLNVAHEALSQNGAVSEAVAAQMAGGVRDALGVDVGLAVTGIAGPAGAAPQKPVGLVYAGVADNRNIEVKELRLTGDRLLIQQRTAIAALNLARLFLQKRSAGVR